MRSSSSDPNHHMSPRQCQAPFNEEEHHPYPQADNGRCGGVYSHRGVCPSIKHPSSPHRSSSHNNSDRQISTVLLSHQSGKSHSRHSGKSLYSLYDDKCSGRSSVYNGACSGMHSHSSVKSIMTVHSHKSGKTITKLGSNNSKFSCKSQHLANSSSLSSLESGINSPHRDSKNSSQSSIFKSKSSQLPKTVLL